MLKAKVGFVGFGEVNTPREIIERKCQRAIEWLQSADMEVISTAPVSDDPDGRDVRRAVAELSQADFDLLITCLAGWIPSHAVISVTNEFRYLPSCFGGYPGVRRMGDWSPPPNRPEPQRCAKPWKIWG